VMRLLPDGLSVTEIAPGVDLARDVLERVPIPLRVSPELRQMDERLFRPERMRLQLRATEDPVDGRLAPIARDEAMPVGRV
jgi:acyl CoA:acetate/3-ketoacid CoA transferase